MFWAHQQGAEGKDFRETADAAASAGTLAHKMAEHDIKGLSFPYDSFTNVSDEIEEKARNAFSGYSAWKRMTRLRLVESEVSLVSEIDKYGGTLDATAEIDGHLDLIDFKTSGGTYEDHLIQVAAYTNLWNENRQDFIHGIHILRFPKDGGSFHHSYFTAEKLIPAMRTFRLLRELYNLKKVLKKLL